jgi:hypothetical protein
MSGHDIGAAGRIMMDLLEKVLGFSRKDIVLMLESYVLK